MNNDFSIILIDLEKREHQLGVLALLNEYMCDPMGNNSPLDPQKGGQIIKGLRQHPTYTGFFIEQEGELAGLANCFINFSTFKALPLLNIHDFIISPKFRRKQLGTKLLTGIEEYARLHNYCRINLEVREDNLKARNLYRKMGFQPCKPNMFFWEKNLTEKELSD